MSDNPYADMTGINKSFSGNQVLRNVNFTVNTGEVHALMGENGAGKSTLIKVMTGIHQRDSGTINIKGKPVHFTNPKEAENHGISVIHQELNIIPYLSVTQNMFLGKEITYSKTGILNKRKMREITEENLKRLGVTSINPDEMASDLSVGEQQLVEIAQALSTNAEMIIMDEPTAALTETEAVNLFNVIASLKQQHVSIVYISHRMKEIFEICDRVTVLRDGEYVGTKVIQDTSFPEVVKMMVGRELGEQFPEQDAEIGDVVLEISGLKRKGIFSNIGFSVKKGEILGVAGLMGAGRSEIMETIFGYAKKDNGSVILDGKKLNIKHPDDAIKAGIAFITEDRKSKGLVIDASIRENIALTNLKSISNSGIVSKKSEKKVVADLIERLNIRMTGSEQGVKSLSGGNQQKVVAAKWLGINPRVLILDEPTRGVDVGAKKEIYIIIQELTRRGVAIIMISSELPEILGVSDRIMVIHEGSVSGFMDRNNADQEKIMTLATGGSTNETNAN